MHVAGWQGVASCLSHFWIWIYADLASTSWSPCSWGATARALHKGRGGAGHAACCTDAQAPPQAQMLAWCNYAHRHGLGSSGRPAGQHPLPEAEWRGRLATRRRRPSPPGARPGRGAWGSQSLSGVLRGRDPGLAAPGQTPCSEPSTPAGGRGSCSGPRPRRAPISPLFQGCKPHLRSEDPSTSQTAPLSTPPDPLLSRALPTPARAAPRTRLTTETHPRPVKPSRQPPATSMATAALLPHHDLAARTMVRGASSRGPDGHGRATGAAP